MSLGVFSISSIRFLCFHFLSWNKSEMETPPDPSQEKGHGTRASSRQFSHHPAYGACFFFPENSSVQAKASMATWKKVRGFCKRQLTVTTSIFIRTYYGWPLGLTLQLDVPTETSSSLQCLENADTLGLESQPPSGAQPNTPLKPCFFSFLNLLFRLKRKKPRAFRNPKG